MKEADMAKMSLEMMLPHIAEYVLKDKKWRPLMKIKKMVDTADLIGDIWLRGMTKNTVDARQVREYYDEWEGDEAQARERIKWLVKAHVKNTIEKIEDRKNAELNNVEAIIENTVSQGSHTMSNSFLNIPISEDEKVLILWKLDIIDEKETLEALGCSIRTVYNRYEKLKTKLKEAIRGDK
jgi:hypothetical protein